MENTITRDQILSWGPCCRELGEKYDDKHLEALFAGREALTPEDTVALGIPSADVVWVWASPVALSPDVLRRWVEKTTERAIRLYAIPCAATRAWANRWLSGEDRCYESACDAANDAAATSIAAYACSVAACAAAAAHGGAYAVFNEDNDAAYTAAHGGTVGSVGSWRAAGDIARAASAAARKAQVADLLAVVEEASQ